VVVVSDPGNQYVSKTQVGRGRTIGEDVIVVALVLILIYPLGLDLTLGLDLILSSILVLTLDGSFPRRRRGRNRRN